LYASTNPGTFWIPNGARAFQPGEFYRLQNYESFAPLSAAQLWQWKVSP
jgi:hypothetical protein